MKSFLSCIIALVMGIGISGTALANSFSVVPQGAGYEATYSAYIPPTINGNDVTNIMFFEAGSGGQVRTVNFPGTLAGGGISVLTDTLTFSPTSALIVGLDLPLNAAEKRHLVMFVSDAFAVSASGKIFSEALPPLHEQAFIDDFLLAYGGDNAKLNLVQSYFMNGPLDDAAFGLGGSFRVVESSVFPVVPEPATMLLFGSGLIGLAGFSRRFKRS